MECFMSFMWLCNYLMINIGANSEKTTQTVIKTNSNSEIDKLIKDLIIPELLQYTIQFFYKTDKGLRPFGTGVLALIHGTHFILTASHVADYLQENANELFIQVDKNKYINVIGDIKYTDINKSQGIDLSYVKIGKDMVEPLSKPYEFLPIDKFSKHNRMLDASNYCVLGFPENNIKFNNGISETGANFYLTSASNEKPYEFYKYNKSDFFLVEMKGKGIDIDSGGKGKINTHFYGISGCGLWYLDFNMNPISTEYLIDYRLIGIMTEFKKGKYFCLVANKIHLFIEAFRTIEGFKFKEKST